MESTSNIKDITQLETKSGGSLQPMLSFNLQQVQSREKERIEHLARLKKTEEAYEEYYTECIAYPSDQMTVDVEIAQTNLEDTADKEEAEAVKNKTKNAQFQVSDPSWISEGVLNKAVEEYAENKTPYLPRKTKLSDDYTIDKQIGRGGYGRVYRLTSKTGEKLVAKVEVCENKSTKDRIDEEVNTANSLGSYAPIVKANFIYKKKFDVDGKEMTVDLSVIVMEEMHASLSNLMVITPFCDLETSTKLFIQVLFGLKLLHGKGFLHNDIKPHNVMARLRADGKTDLKLIDYGLVTKYVDDKGKPLDPTTEPSRGTPNYMSLEVQQGNSPSRKSDLVSVVYMVINLTNGSLRWQGKDKETVMKLKEEWPISRLVQGLPPAITKVCLMVENLGFAERPDYDEMVFILEDSLYSIKEEHLKKWKDMMKILDETLKNGLIPKTMTHFNPATFACTDNFDLSWNRVALEWKHYVKAEFPSQDKQGQMLQINQCRAEQPSFNLAYPEGIKTEGTEQRELSVILADGYPVIFKGEFIAGTNTRHGKGIQIDTVGDIKEGFWNNGKEHGIQRWIRAGWITINSYQNGSQKYYMVYRPLYDGKWKEGTTKYGDTRTINANGIIDMTEEKKQKWIKEAKCNMPLNWYSVLEELGCDTTRLKGFQTWYDPEQEELLRQQKLRQQFDDMDENKDGNVSKEELQKLLQVDEDEIFNILINITNSNEEGQDQFTFTQYQNILSSKAFTQMSKIRKLFDKYDYDKDGFVTKEDLKKKCPEEKVNKMFSNSKEEDRLTFAEFFYEWFNLV